MATKSKSKTTEAPAAAAAPVAADSWYRRGSDGFTKKRQLDSAAALKKERAVSRFFLKAGEEATIVFIDGDEKNPPFWVSEHSVQIDGRWGNFITCVKELMPCPVCETGSRPTYTGYFTVIDTREFTRKDGTKVKNRRVLYPAKGSTIRVIDDLIKQHGSLVGRAFNVRRLSSEDPNCGRDFTYKGKVDLAKKLPPEDLKAHDYMKILRPLDEKEMAGLGYGSEGPGVGGGEEPAGAAATTGTDANDLI